MTTHIFAGNPLDRCEAERRDEAWLANTFGKAETRVLLFHRLEVLTRMADDGLVLDWLHGDQALALTGDAAPVLLGKRDGIIHYALDVSHRDDPLADAGVSDSSQFMDCRAAAMQLDLPDSGIVAQARAQTDWHRRHRYCSVCGQPSTPRKGGHVRVCDTCAAEHFPRTDPVAIMLVVRGDRCLLGQPKGPLVRMGVYSALAGFIDQGEAIEEAVRREVMEEAGLPVGIVRYHSSQPWPFPSSLMIGCHAVALSDDIHMDTEEMHDVRWFTRDEILQARDNRHPSLKLPGPIAIAHHLINAWVDGEVDIDS
ncbi:MAG: NAD(+) diphosphatase [Pseudomonadales bacterium]|nr:NAD(+) diphosphatase [Pseudomonadales bacterium]